MTNRRAAFTLVVVLLSLAVGTARAEDVTRDVAQDVADEAQFHFSRGNQLYRQGRFDEALVELYASKRLVPNRNVKFNIARCLEQLKLYDEAFRAWSALADGNAPADERATIKAAIDKLRPQLALLQVTTDPPGAAIYINRRDLGALGPRRAAWRWRLAAQRCCWTCPATTPSPSPWSWPKGPRNRSRPRWSASTAPWCSAACRPAPPCVTGQSTGRWS